MSKAIFDEVGYIFTDQPALESLNLKILLNMTWNGAICIEHSSNIGEAEFSKIY